MDTNLGVKVEKDFIDDVYSVIRYRKMQTTFFHKQFAGWMIDNELTQIKNKLNECKWFQFIKKNKLEKYFNFVKSLVVSTSENYRLSNLVQRIERETFVINESDNEFYVMKDDFFEELKEFKENPDKDLITKEQIFNRIDKIRDTYLGIFHCEKYIDWDLEMPEIQE
jgi:hypothetical protein